MVQDGLVKAVKLRAGEVPTLHQGFERIRNHLCVPQAFPPEVEREAQEVARRRPVEGPERSDRRDIEFVTIDPAGSMDLDQAFAGTRQISGYRVYYAIADVGHFVDPGGALDTESVVRGSTLYSPDGRAPLYPTALGEGAGSLLPDSDRPAVLWTFDVDARGLVTDVGVERSIIRSRRQLSYVEAQAEIDAPDVPEVLQVLKEVGSARQEVEKERGGVNLRIPDQQIEATFEPAGYEVIYRTEFPVEGWNAQMSLMTGIAAGTLMMERGTGLLRTLPEPSDETVQGLRSSAAALGLPWPKAMAYQEFVRNLDPSRPKGAAMISAARVLFRGAGYTFFNGQNPEQPNHYAVAAPYAHVTAPLRRMADRLCNELLLLGDAEPPAWLLEGLEVAPEIMRAADKRSRELESRMVDFVEAQMLAGRVGEVFQGLVVQTGAKGALIQVGRPAVMATAQGTGTKLGDQVSVRLATADPELGEIGFELA